MNLQDRYAQLCAELGDLTMKYDRIVARLSEVKAEINVLDAIAAQAKKATSETQK